MLIRNVPKLYCIETIDSIKLANKINNTYGIAKEEGIIQHKKFQNKDNFQDENEKEIDDNYQAEQNDNDNKNIKLNVMIQINSSGEKQKGGVENIEEAIELVTFIKEKCHNLNLIGLMTIGRADYTAGPENFSYMHKCRDTIIDTFPEYNTNNLKLSMGMSNDYQVAIEHGSNSVRVGSSIFGKRNYNTNK